MPGILEAKERIKKERKGGRGNGGGSGFPVQLCSYYATAGARAGVLAAPSRFPKAVLYLTNQRKYYLPVCHAIRCP